MILHFVIVTRAEHGEGVEEVDGYVQTGCYPDGRLGEIFVRTGKAGSSAALLDEWAKGFSFCLQLGADVDWLCSKYIGTRFAPSGAVLGVDGVKRCTSTVDLICRWLLTKYAKPAETAAKETA